MQRRVSEVALEHAAATLAVLSREAKNCADIVAAGGIAPVVALLSSGTTGAKRHAAVGLARLQVSSPAAPPQAQLPAPSAGRALPEGQQPNPTDARSAGGELPLASEQRTSPPWRLLAVVAAGSGSRA